MPSWVSVSGLDVRVGLMQVHTSAGKWFAFYGRQEGLAGSRLRIARNAGAAEPSVAVGWWSLLARGHGWTIPQSSGRMPISSSDGPS